MTKFKTPFRVDDGIILDAEERKVDVRPIDTSAVALSFSGLLPDPERDSPFPERQQEQSDVLLAPSDAMTPLGILRTVSSSKIEDSGVSIGFECLDRDVFDPTRCYDLLATAGVKHARCQTGWCKCEKRKGALDFAWLDNIVDSLLSRGVQPWFNLGFGNKLYMPEAYGETAVGHVPLYYGDETLEAWKRYVEAIALHFSGRVTHWEIWNEPEIPEFWQPSKPSFREYARLIELTAPLIRRNCTSARIGACSFAARHPYAIELIKLGIGRHIDFYSVHAYKVVPEIGFAEAMAEYRALLDVHGGRQVQLWQGESGFASHFPPNHWLQPTVLDSERNQAKWLLRRFLTDRRAGCVRTSFFQMVDMIQKPYQMGNVTRTDPARHGILHGRTYRPKPSYHALANYCAVFDNHAEYLGSTGIQGRFPGAPACEADAARAVADALVGDVYRRNGFPLYLYYLPENVQNAYPGARGLALTCPSVSASRRIEHPVLVDFLRGRVFALNQVRFNDDGSYCLDDLPLADHPLMITDADAIPWITLEAARANKINNESDDERGGR